MRISSCFILLAAIATAPLIGGRVSAADRPPSSPQQVVKLYSSGARALAMLSIGDGTPAPVIFDTGTDVNMLSRKYADPLALAVLGSSESIDLATGTKTTLPLVSLGRAQLGSALIRDTTSQLFTNAAEDSVGVFGPASFSGSLVILELAKGRLRIVAPDAGLTPQQPAEPYADNLPAARIEVSGMQLTAHLDSGSNAGLILSKSLMGKVKLKAPARPGPVAYSASGSQQVYVGQIDGDLKVGALTIRDPRVTFAAIKEANIGYAILRQTTLVMDPAEKRSWLLNPSVDVPAIEEMLGTYGTATVSFAGGRLTFTRTGADPVLLTSLGSGLFEDTGTGELFQFVRSGPTVRALMTISPGGRTSLEPKRP